MALKRHPAEFEEFVEWTSPTRHSPSRSLESDASGDLQNRLREALGWPPAKQQNPG
ncbi:MAG TPA: hypothetical protein VK830_08495 [Xanthomonadales bacterium]|nr:hypothetical protein [Xanthomonadales bacterium]